MDELHEFVDISEAFQQQILKSIIDLIKHERKRRSLWTKIKNYLSRIKHIKCICPGGSGCEFDVSPPPQLLPQKVCIRKNSLGGRECHSDSDSDDASTPVNNNTKLPPKQEHLEKPKARTSITLI